MVGEIAALKQSTEEFRKRFVKRGPMVASIKPEEMHKRLKDFRQEFSVYVRNYL